MKRDELTQAMLMEMLLYNPDTGVFTWRGGRFDARGRRITRFVGTPAGTPITAGHISIYLHVDKRHYLAHRLAWLYTYGEFPKGLVDHVNRDPSDNRIANLRLATRSENAMNAGMWSHNTSGYKGVCWDKKSCSWMAYVKKDKRMVFRKHFNSKDDAALAVREARKQIHGEFANHG